MREAPQSGPKIVSCNTDPGVAGEQVDVTPVQRAIMRLWAKSFTSEDQADLSAEFSELARECHAQYGSPERLQGSASLDWHKDKLRTAFRNIGAPWYVGPSLHAANVSEIIHFGYDGGPSTRTYLVPLNEAPEGLPSVEFGPCRIGSLSKEKLADIVKPAPLKRHHRTQFDLEMLCQITWLVAEEAVQLPPAKERDFMSRLWRYDLGNLEHLSYPDSIPDSLYHRPTLELQFNEPTSTIIARALVTLLLHPWEEFVRSHQVWRPFLVPWVYVVNYDPFEIPPSAPDISSLSWDSALGSDARVDERAWPARTQFLGGAFDDLKVKLRETWRSLEVSGQAFNPWIEHFLLRAYWEKGIDELVMHMTAIDAAIGKQQNRMTEAIGKRLQRLLNDEGASQEFKRLYDLRASTSTAELEANRFQNRP